MFSASETERVGGRMGVSVKKTSCPACFIIVCVAVAIVVVADCQKQGKEKWNCNKVKGDRHAVDQLTRDRVDKAGTKRKREGEMQSAVTCLCCLAVCKSI